jgi:hypothetical protein
MTFELTEKSEVDTIWFMNGPSGRFDVLAMLWRPNPEENWRLQWRFRYYDPKTDEVERANWYKAVYEGDDPNYREKAREHWGLVMATGAESGVLSGELDSLDARGLSLSQLVEAMQKKSWCRVREERVH